MSKARLLACPTCARHVRLDEGVCPFCAAKLPASWSRLREDGVPLSPATRLSRAALYALRMGTLSATTVACGGAVGGGAGEQPDSDQGDSVAIFEAAYGGPPPDGSFVGAAYGGPVFIDGNVLPAYGLAPLPESGLVDSATHSDAGSSDAAQTDAAPRDASPSDASRSDGFIAPPYGLPAYGLPPMPPRGANGSE
jgi:hypothetical protein